ncbi:MAG TPA: adenylate/guanylate cyclase domain-containing protein [Solirubrobacteraceae bacterium]
MAVTRELPAGVVTFLFTDIEGSTRLLRTLGAGYRAVLDLHRAVLAGAWGDHGGHVVGTEGDSFLVAFAGAADALAAAVEAQRRIAAVSWPDGVVLRVRIGLHAGYAQPRHGDYAALAVHQAARVVAAAHGGQVLLTGAVAERLGAAPAGAHVERLGRFRVRDFEGPAELYRAAGPGAAVVDLPPRVRPADGHNLVRPSTSLVGRDDDRARVLELTRPGTVTTLCGPGGVGKTRLAIEVALVAAGDWADGVWLVDLAPVTEPGVVPATIAETIGAAAVAGVDPWAEVCAHLAEREALIVLDNCEQLAATAAARAAGLLAACPRVGVLATSRVPLGLRGEQVHRLAPLATAGPDAAAARLFLERATHDSGADPGAVRELCAELDGLPLAIELAAARTTVLGPREILERLRRSPSVLRSRDPALPERQRTIERLLDWSCDLLEPDERTALRRLSVLPDGFDLELAEVACATEDVAADEVPELVWALVDASLVATDAAAGATRYRLLATVRAHVAQHASGTERAAALARVTRAYLERLGPAHVNDPAWVGSVGAELNNLREAVAHGGDETAAQALAWSIAAYHDLTDAFRTGIEETTRWAARFRAPGPCRVGLLTRLADLHLCVGELDAATALADEAAAMAQATGLPEWDDAGLVHTRCEIAQRRGDLGEAAALAEQALAEPHSMRGQTRLLNALGIALGAQGDLEGAAGAFERELAVAQDARLPTFLATTHGNLAETYLRLGDEPAAARHQVASLELAREQGRPVLIGFSMMIAARLVAARGAPAEAVTLQAAADDVLERAAFALYAEDAEVRDELMQAARRDLGDAAFEQALAEGRALHPDAARDRAAAVLREAEGESTDKEAVR